jgi:hypothetical protein
MGVFDDKKFEKLDWMTQITETIDSELNTLLARLPERIEFNMAKISMWVSSGSQFSISVNSVVRELLRETLHNHTMTYEEIGKITDCFKFEMSSTLTVNFESNTMTGTLTLVKIVPTLADEELQPMMGKKGIEAVGQVNFEDKWPLDRLNEMLDVLGKGEEAQKNRSYKKKMSRIKERLKEIFRDNEWRIRDMALADRVGIWIADYITTGNLAALTNFCKLKVMTHNNMPIYSVEEEK